jgi:hypothetical protein
VAEYSVQKVQDKSTMVAWCFFAMAKLRSAPGMRERAPEVWELVVQVGRDPVSGKHRQISRTFRGNLRNAKKARADLIVEVSKGGHFGSRATVDDLFADCIVELEARAARRTPSKATRRCTDVTSCDVRHEAGRQGDDEDAHRSVRRARSRALLARGSACAERVGNR